MKEIQRRVAAVQKTEKRYRGRAFHWGKAATCAHLMRYHAANMGHKLPVVPRFRSQLTAQKALNGTGCKTLTEWLDKHFERIPAAFLRVGDLIAMPGDSIFPALLVKGDRNKFLGWHESEEGCTIVELDVGAAEGAWRL